MKQHAIQRLQPQPARRGFTLVEMLVSVALLLLIMTLFAQAFGIAAGSIRTQRGVAENDQRARSLVTILLGDLRKRTFRQREDAITANIDPPDDVAPFSAPDQLVRLENRANRLSLGLVPLHPDYFNGGDSNSSTRLVDVNRERGYFHYSEGDPTNDEDDILQFTIDVNQTDLGSEDTTLLVGRARVIVAPDDPSPPGTGSAATWFNGRPNNVDQPIWDDGKGFQVSGAGVPFSYGPADTGKSESRFAEVSYFIRNGKLHRRVLLIRDPLPHMVGAGTGLGQPHVGATGAGAAMILGAYDGEDGSPSATGASDFWNDFDFSAQFFPPGAPGGVNVFFNEIAGLDNSTAGVSDGGIPPRFLALGNPQSRFGHDPLPQFGSPDGLQGRPKEYWDPTDTGTFFARYSHEETSHPNFRFPGTAGYSGGPVGASPMSTGAGPLPNIVDANGDRVIDHFANGPRQGEDILLSNCHAFDIKVWDDVIAAFVDIGHSQTVTVAGVPVAGDYHLRQVVPTGAMVNFNPDPMVNQPGRFQAAQRGMFRYGGLLGTNRVLDTWHPGFDFDTTRDGRPGDGGPGGINDGSGAADDVPPFRPLWSERETFGANFEFGGTGGPGGPAAPFLQGNAPTYYDPDTTGGGTNSDGYDVGERVFPRPDQTLTPTATFHGHQSFFYVATIRPGSGSDGTDMVPASTTAEPEWPESPGATVDDGDIRWKAMPNVIGLKAIQVSVRFFDPASGQIRQLTLTHSFVEL